MRPCRAGLLALGLILTSASATAAQEAAADTTRPERRPSEPIPLDTIAAFADTVPVLSPRFQAQRGPERLARVPSEDLLPKNPRNAAIRAFVIPGWGQFYTGHPWRGIFWAAAEIGTFTLGYRQQLRALDKQDELEAARQEFFATAPDSLLADTLALIEAFDRSLEARTIRGELAQIEDRREDWYAYFALSVIFAAVDAYVSAQLDPIRVRGEPNGRVSVGLALPLGRDPKRRSP